MPTNPASPAATIRGPLYARELMLVGTLVNRLGAVVFKMIMTGLSLVGRIKFADSAQQKKLFAGRIVELVIGVGAKACGGATLNREVVGVALEHRGRNQAVVEVIGALEAAPSDRTQINALVGLIPPVNGETTAENTARVHAEFSSLPLCIDNERAVTLVRARSGRSWGDRTQA